VFSVKRSGILFFMTIAVVCFFATTLFVSAAATPPDELPLQASIDTFEAAKLNSNAFTQMDDERIIVNHLDIPDTYLLAAEDDRVELWYEPGNYSIRVRSKVTGYIHGSSFAKKGVDIPNFNQTFEKRVNSAVGVEYYEYDETSGVYTAKEEYILDSELTTTTFEAITGGFSSRITFGLSKIALTLRVWLEDGDLKIEILNDSISEDPAFPLRSIRVYPYFGATFGDQNPGYILVPDGSGALVRYRPVDAITDVYQLNYYLTDQGVRKYVQDEAELTLPVFGMIHGIRQNGFLGIVEAGAESAALVVSPAKSNLRYYLTYPQFVYRQLYAAPTSRAAAQSDSGKQVIQEALASFDIALKYRFLYEEKADYVGMANSYREYLIETGAIAAKEGSASVIPTAIEWIGGERTEGFLFDQIEIATTYQAATQMLLSLQGELGPIHAVYKGIFQGGYSGSGPAANRNLNQLGSIQELTELQTAIQETGGTLSLYTDPLLLFEDSSYNAYSDVAMKVNQQLLSGFGLTGAIAWATPLRAMELLERKIDVWSKHGFTDYALGSIGRVLYSDYKTSPLDRTEVADLYQSRLNQLDVALSLYRPNAYLLSAADRYLGAPMVNSRYTIYTDTIPFLQIALAGTIDVYGNFLNFAADRDAALLQMMDYGVYPAYVLTEASAYVLQDTELGMLYSSSFATWNSEIVANHQRLNPILAPAIGSRVVSRDVLVSGFVRVTYANDVVIYVNYTATAQFDGAIEVAPKSARTVQGDA
jgi:hypothetical protein